MSFVYCRANLDRCMGVAAFDLEQLVGGNVEGWDDVREVPSAKWKGEMYQGVCPACIAASKPTSEKRRISGGTRFDPVEIEAGGSGVGTEAVAATYRRILRPAEAARGRHVR